VATSKNSSRAKKSSGKTELSRLLGKYLNEMGRSKKEITQTMRPRRIVRSNKKGSESKHLIKVASGSAIPEFDYLLEIVTAISVKDGRELTSSEVALWLSSWLQDYLQKYPKAAKVKTIDSKKSNKSKLETKKKAADLQHEAATAFVKKAVTATAAWRGTLDVGRNIDRAYPPTLFRKNYILHNCVIIVGASVRHPPSSTEQLFRQSAQLTDVLYLPHLNCGPDPLMLTDNMVIALSDSERKELLGKKHLLVIGGPIVNVATRYLNNESIFPFCFDEQKRRFDNIFDTLKTLQSLRNGKAVKDFYEMLQEPASKIDLNSGNYSGKNVKNIWADVEKFRKEFELNENVTYDHILGLLTGIHALFDPLSMRVMKSQNKDTNLGVISLGKNHWADDPHYVCVTVAGINPFGTVGALRALVYSTFYDHPCGGILDVPLPKDHSEFKRFTDAEFEWVTDKYSVATLKSGLEKVREANRKNGSTNYPFHGNAHYFEEYKEFVESFKE
jgi:hypothetical protein